MRDEEHPSLQRDPRTDPKPDPPRTFAPEIPGGTGEVKAKPFFVLQGVGMVQAWTKSEARAEFKRRLHLGPKDRLPIGFKVRRLDT